MLPFLSLLILQFSNSAILSHHSLESSSLYIVSNFAPSYYVLLLFSFVLSSLNLSSSSQRTSVLILDQGCHHFSLHPLSSITEQFLLSTKREHVEYATTTTVVMKKCCSIAQRLAFRWKQEVSKYHVHSKNSVSCDVTPCGYQCFRGISVLTKTTRRNVPQDDILHSHRCETLKSCTALTGWAV
jgi:hypothetical protein